MKEFDFNGILSNNQTQKNDSGNDLVSSIINENLNDNTRIINIDINMLDAIENQPFRKYDKSDLEELKSSIEKNGLLSPLVVNKNNDRYTILCGRNRYTACMNLGWTTIPCKVLDVDEIKANLIMVDSNLNQRQQLRPSEKALAYRMQRESIAKMKNVSFSKAVEDLSQYESSRNIYRYIKLSELSPQLLTFVDSGNITVTAGVLLTDFSFQDILAEYLNNNNKKINDNLAASLVDLQKNKEIDYDTLNSFFNYKPIKERKIIKVDYTRINSIIDDSNKMSDEELEDYIVNAIDYYRQNHEK